MGWFSSKDEHHGDECRDGSGAWWAKPNPMGWGNDEPRTVKRAGRDARSQNNRPANHGSKAEKTLLSGTGGFIDWGLSPARHIQVAGEKPTGRNRRP